MTQSEQLIRNVVDLGSSTLTSLTLLSEHVYDTQPDKQLLLSYMSVLLAKLYMDEMIDNTFEEPLEFRMECLDTVKGIYDRLQK